MSEERASGAPAENENTGVANGVAGTADDNSEGFIPADDFNSWKSKMDSQLAQRDGQIQQLSSSLEQLQQQAQAAREETVALKTENMTPTERAAFERDEALREVERYRQQERETEAKRLIAADVARGLDVPVDSLMEAKDKDEMYAIAGRLVEERVAAIHQRVVTPGPANSPAPSGVTLGDNQEPDINDARRKMLAERDNQAFIKSFMPSSKI